MPYVTDKRSTNVLQCKACRIHIGYGPARVAFCSDVACMVTRDWVWGDQDALAQRIVFFVEQYGLSHGEIGKALGLSRVFVNGIYKNFQTRKFVTLS